MLRIDFAPTTSLNLLSLAQRERLAYIEFCAYFLGEIRRSDITNHFAVQTAAATRDLAEYRRLTGNQLEFDQLTKSYRPSANFHLIFPQNPERALSTLTLGFGTSARSQHSPLIPSETLKQLNQPTLRILSAVTRAIHRKGVLHTRYHSFSSGVMERELIPFALANNGVRWHVRAFDRLKSKFNDFVLTRMQTAEDIPNAAIEEHERPQADDQWNRIVELQIVPHPKEGKNKAAIAVDYGMEDGVLRAKVRAAMAGYFLRQWLVDSSEDATLQSKEIRLWLKNRLSLYGVDSATFAPGFDPIRD